MKNEYKDERAIIKIAIIYALLFILVLGLQQKKHKKVICEMNKKILVNENEIRKLRISYKT